MNTRLFVPTTFASVALINAATAQVPITGVGFSGLPAPGLPAGTTYTPYASSYDTPWIDDAGRVYFMAQLLTPPSVYTTALMGQDSSGMLSVLYRQGGPGPAGGAIGTFIGRRYAAEGNGIMPLSLGTPSGSHFWPTPEGLVPIARYLQPAPGVPDMFFSSFDQRPIGFGQGRGGFVAEITDIFETIEDFGIWRVSPAGDVSLVDFGRGVLRDCQVAGDRVAYSVDGYLSLSLYAVWMTGSAGVPERRCQIDDPAPGVPAGLLFTNIQDFDCNTAGRLMFRASLYRPGDPSLLGDGVWVSDSPTNLRALAFTGSHAPGFPPGVKIQSVGKPYVNARGEIAFSVTLQIGSGGVTSENDQAAILFTLGATPQVLARKGWAAPGAPGRTFLSADVVGMNNIGQVALSAFTGPANSNGGLWVYDSGRGLLRVAGGGDAVTLPSGQHRTVEEVVVTRDSGGQDGLPRMMNDHGDVAFGVTFRPSEGGGTAIYSAHIAPGCYANCDESSVAPVLNINDFICFQQRFAAGDSYANCDGSTSAPVLNVNDFICFQQKFAAGCQ